VVAIVESDAQRLTELGCAVAPATPPIGDIVPMISTMRAFGNLFLSEELSGRAGRVDNPLLGEYLERARTLGAADLAAAWRAHARYIERMAAFFSEYDLLVTPATATPAYRLDEMFAPEVDGVAVPGAVEGTLLTYAFTMAQLPAISLPAGITSAGLPIGMQLIGGRHADRLLLQVAAAYERVWPWTDVIPPTAL
jgi:aspartyl-tRNA(Asn)/glutamyl-tRNA(Gln) amidotransferase subunit A